MAYMDNKLIYLATYLKKVLTVEENICHARHQEKAFNFLKLILDKLKC